MGSTTTQSHNFTTLSTTDPSGTNPSGYPTPPSFPAANSESFPLTPGVDDSQCGNIAFDPVITNFDYVSQDLYVRGDAGKYETNDYVVNGEEAVGYRKLQMFFDCLLLFNLS